MEENKKIRVALYIRVSTAEQLNGFSPDMQEQDLKAHVERKAYKNWVTKPEWIFQEQASGADINRNELKRLMDMAKKKEFDLVLVWKIDRISRSLSDLLNIFETLKKYDVGFASLKEDIDFTGPIGRLVFQIFGALAEFERETIKMRTEEGKRMSALLGNFVTGSVPYGYKKIPNKNGKGSKLQLIPKEAKILKQIFHWFVYERKPMSQIAKELNKMGTPKGEGARISVKHIKWLERNIKGILTNEIYRGQSITNRFKKVSSKPKRYIERPREEWIMNSVEPAISTLLFIQAQERIKNGIKGMRGGGGEVYMLAGKLVDMTTGKGFVGYRSTKGTKNYRRKKIPNQKEGAGNKSMSIAARDLENFVWEYIEKAIRQPKIFLEIHKKNSENFKKQEALQAKYKIYEDAFSRANSRIEKVQRDYYDGNIESEERDSRVIEYTEERDANCKKLKEVESELARLSQYDVGCRDLEALSKNMEEDAKKLSYEQKKDIVSMLVEKVEIHETKDERKAKVFLRFDQKAISSAIPMGRTNFWLQENDFFVPKRQTLYLGGA